ncbi:hypothetical protein DMB38_28790 [Streptomyces sp. WAC 06738]|uniref:hypothetical protein n=1 Tax=Streptomyces sp. WAC 06738 TaxID=2203210 RepID=UPI000F6EBBDF|nr:hypothetical protein [Streptomyces sp. WAC 06738]AZM49254.1 hypothetical protein DMB38_28790 [Streptomyces sp. WAC 06738]
MAAEHAGQVPYEAKMFTLLVGLSFCAFGLACFFRHRQVAGFLQSLAAQNRTRTHPNDGFPSSGYVRGFGVLFLAIATGLCAFAIALLGGWELPGGQ